MGPGTPQRAQINPQVYREGVESDNQIHILQVCSGSGLTGPVHPHPYMAGGGGGWQHRGEGRRREGRGRRGLGGVRMGVYKEVLIGVVGGCSGEGGRM